MDTYTSVAAELSRLLTIRYSTSFGSASRLYDSSIRPHIFNIYGWVRVADEIVDTYKGDDAREVLDNFKKDTYRALETGFSTNPIIHSFVATAKQYKFGSELIDPFLSSMEMDITPPVKYTRALYDKYIYGSAQVVGLMCLRVFTDGNESTYAHLKPGAEALGAAFQKVNFLRDFAEDTRTLGRSYFPEVKNNILDDATKDKIVLDIKHDFSHSIPALHQLPKNSKTAVTVATRYYFALLIKLDETPASIISTSRVRITDLKKAQILASVRAKNSLNRVVS